jgi:ubiquinone/menaquinone biosynthesis C-methylase UbiE
MSTKLVQGMLWSTAPRYWSQHFEPWFAPMYKTVLNQLELSEKHLLLDAGCGSGLFSHLVVKTGAEVIGIDAAQGLLEIARVRNPQISFLQEDLETLPFRDSNFVVVTGFNSFQYAGSFDKALLEAKRVLKPGGRLVLGIWDKPEMSEATNVLKAIGTLLPPPPPGTPGPFALSEDGRIEADFAKNNLKLIYKTRVSCPFLYDGLTESIKSFMGTGPAAAAMNHGSRIIVEETISKALKPFHLVDEFYFLQNSFLVFIGEK